MTRERWTEVGTTIALLALSVGMVHSVRDRLATVHRHVKETSDVYVLPPPDQVVKLSLGYRSALADLLWAHVLVSQGLHTYERRRFENLSLFMDSINELEPSFREPYLLADALYTFQGGETPREEVLKARQVMERGTRELPLDGDIWLGLGQFVAYIAPATYLTDEAEQKQWRLDGAQMLVRAAELTGTGTSIAWQAMAAVGILEKAGKREASIAFLRRQLAALGEPELVANPERADDLRELRGKLEGQLAKLAGEKDAEIMRRRLARIAKMRSDDLPWSSADRIFVVGPRIDAPWCSGALHEDDAACALTWYEWSKRSDFTTDAPTEGTGSH